MLFLKKKGSSRCCGKGWSWIKQQKRTCKRYYDTM